jgi:transcriptional regulator with XRE-family HTH domain
METIGKRLKRLRLSRGLSQRELSSPGVSYAYISRIEAGARTPSVKALRKLAPKLGVSVEYLETGYESPVQAGVSEAGLDLADLTDDEHLAIKTAADAGARREALVAALRVVDQREAARLADLEAQAAEIRLRREGAR